MITVKVGNNGTTFPVHESVVCDSSAFFKSAMKPEWTSATSRIVDLTDEDPNIFEIYLHWLYFKTLSTIHNRPPIADIEYIELAQCYVLGEKLLDMKFKNAVIDALIEVLENDPEDNCFLPDYDIINTIYEGTTEGSPARTLLVDMWQGRATPSCKAALDECPPEFTMDLAKVFLDLNLAANSPWKNSMEKYYEK
jgi:hypothetical protein